MKLGPATLLTLLLLALPARPQDLLRRIDGTQDGMMLGTTIANAGDFDGDGVPDQLVGSPYYDADTPLGFWTDAGRAQVFSGADGSVIWTAPTPSTPGSLTAMAFEGVAGIGDYDGDGRDDIVVGKPGFAIGGFVTVVSGASGQAIAELGDEICRSCSSFAGQSIASVGDWNGDGVPDFAWGDAPDGLFLCNDDGAVRVESGGGGILAQFCPPSPSGRSEGGDSVDGAGDVDDDGLDDVIIGVGGDPSASGDRNQAVVYAATGSLLHLIDFGSSNPADLTPTHHEWVKGLGDLDQDGRDDFAVAAVFPENGSLFSVRVFSGLDASILFDFVGLGDRVAGPGDVSGDGVPDILIGDLQGHANGVVRLFSGASGGLLFERFGDGPDDAYGASVSGAGDVDGDGRPDVLVGALGGPQNPAGYVEILRYDEPIPFTYCTGKLNSQGCVPHVDWSGTPPLGGLDDFLVSTRDTLLGKPGLLFFGTSGPVVAPFAGGVLCVLPPLTRTSPTVATGVSDCNAGHAFHFSHAFVAAAGLAPGDVVNAQFWMRDPDQADGTGVALSDAIEFELLP